MHFRMVGGLDLKVGLTCSCICNKRDASLSGQVSSVELERSFVARRLESVHLLHKEDLVYFIA